MASNSSPLPSLLASRTQLQLLHRNRFFRRAGGRQALSQIVSIEIGRLSRPRPWICSLTVDLAFSLLKEWGIRGGTFLSGRKLDSSFVKVIPWTHSSTRFRVCLYLHCLHRTICESCAAGEGLLEVSRAAECLFGLFFVPSLNAIGLCRQSPRWLRRLVVSFIFWSGPGSRKRNCSLMDRLRSVSPFACFSEANLLSLSSHHFSLQRTKVRTRSMMISQHQMFLWLVNTAHAIVHSFFFCFFNDFITSQSV